VLSDHVQPFAYCHNRTARSTTLLLSNRRIALIARRAIRVARADGRSGQKSFVGFLVDNNKACRVFFGSADSKGS
jgi:hypothetical protein